MSEQLADQDDFKPLVPVYGAYPIPAVLERLEVGTPPDPRRLLHQGDTVIEQIVRAAVDKPRAVSDAPRTENHIPLVTPDNVLVERSSLEHKIKRDSEVSRNITDVITFAGLGQAGGVFDRMRITARSTEYRGGENTGREILPDSWYIYFYKPAAGSPAVEIFRTDYADSYIEVDREESKVMYSSRFSGNEGGERGFANLSNDHPDLIKQLEAAIKEAQLAILGPMHPAISNREAVIARSASRVFRDPHTRRIGRIAHLADMFMELRATYP